jgi:hypothetical protein
MVKQFHQLLIGDGCAVEKCLHGVLWFLSHFTSPMVFSHHICE